MNRRIRQGQGQGQRQRLRFDHRNKDSRRMIGAEEESVLRPVGNIRFVDALFVVQVLLIAGIVGTGDDCAEAMAFGDDDAGGPEVDGDFVRLVVVSDQMGKPGAAVGDQQAFAIGINIGQADGKTGVFLIAVHVENGLDASGQLCVFLKGGAGEKQQVIARFDRPLVKGPRGEKEVSAAECGDGQFGVIGVALGGSCFSC